MRPATTTPLWWSTAMQAVKRVSNPSCIQTWPRRLGSASETETAQGSSRACPWPHPYPAPSAPLLAPRLSHRWTGGPATRTPLHGYPAHGALSSLLSPRPSLVSPLSSLLSPSPLSPLRRLSRRRRLSRHRHLSHRRHRLTRMRRSSSTATPSSTSSSRPCYSATL